VTSVGYEEPVMYLLHWELRDSSDLDPSQTV
jgi:hypothetical protein